jgi:hypothetical protein
MPMTIKVAIVRDLGLGLVPEIEEQTIDRSLASNPIDQPLLNGKRRTLIHLFSLFDVPRVR